MEYLLPPDILQPAVQILDLLRNLTQFPLVRTLNRARLPNRQIQRQFHLSVPLPLAQPASRRGASRREADAVLAGVGGAEGEFARVGAFGVDDAVVVVEDFVDGDGDGEIGVCVEGAVLGLEGAVVACHTMD